jgi:hypothetical protein
LYCCQKSEQTFPRHRLASGGADGGINAVCAVLGTARSCVLTLASFGCRKGRGCDVAAISIAVSGAQATALAETLHVLAAVLLEAVALAAETSTDDPGMLQELSRHRDELDAVQALIARLEGGGPTARLTGPRLLLTEVVESAVVAGLEDLAELSGHASDATLDLHELLSRIDAVRGLVVLLGDIRASEPEARSNIDEDRA